MERRRERRWNTKPLVASLLLHGVAVAALAFSSGEAAAPPKTKVYAVDIVSPPPNMAGAPPMEALSNQEPGPAASAAEAPAEAAPPAPSAPEPEPPAPDPEPAPPPREAPKEQPKEPEKAPEPRRTTPPRPTPPAQRPNATNDRPPASNPPRTNPTRPSPTPEKGRTASERPSSGSTSTTGGTGSGTNRTRGDGTSTAPATGSNPQAGSPGGEGINIHVEGDPCPVAGYCERVTLQVQRYFRPPPGNDGARGEVCFRIQRDGAVTDIQAQRVRGGGAAFRLAMMEAAEAAGSRKAFGTLPGAFDPQRWRWCVELTPR